MTSRTVLESLARRDRLVVLLGLVAATGLAWWYLVEMAAGMTSMPELESVLLSPRVTAWTATEFVVMFLMWAIMMVGMMLPSAAPMILLFALVYRRRQHASAVGPTATFAGGYVAVWGLFSLGATLLQWVLHQGGLLSPMLVTTSTTLGGGALIAAGLYQWTPLKNRCLSHCRSPLTFISQHWTGRSDNAFRLGWTHGRYCLGCCWVLMALLFVGGVMNLLWIAGLAVFVLFEKVLPRRWVPATSGVLLVLWGGLVLAGVSS